MIREISLKRFKCFEQIALQLRRLTLLTGVNASGKSTVVQALSLLRQSAAEAEWAGAMLLEGEFVQLGSLTDVVDKVNGRWSFGIGLKCEIEVGAPSGSCAVDWQFGDPEQQDRASVTIPINATVWREDSVEGSTAEAIGASSKSAYRALLPQALQSPMAMALRALITSIDHIGAERLGPRETYRLGPESWHTVCGVHGERVAGALWWFGNDEIDSRLRLPEHPPTLRAQTQAWLASFFPNVAFELEKVTNANAVTLGFRTSNETGFHRPQHVGYGITHLLPLIVAGLRARTGRVIVIENPEVHLHPAGQSAVGRFLARVARAGATVVVETHSDHVLNGVRRAVREGELESEEVALHFFRERTLAAADGIAQVVSPKLDQNGNIDHWPQGFFDQFDVDLNVLAGIAE